MRSLLMIVAAAALLAAPTSASAQSSEQRAAAVGLALDTLHKRQADGSAAVLASPAEANAERAARHVGFAYGRDAAKAKYRFRILRSQFRGDSTADLSIQMESELPNGRAYFQTSTVVLKRVGQTWRVEKVQMIEVS